MRRILGWFASGLLLGTVAIHAGAATGTSSVPIIPVLNAVDSSPEPFITGVTAAGAQGDLVSIAGSGFGTIAANLDLTVSEPTGTRLVSLRVIRATDSELIARVGPVPPNFLRGPLSVSLGQGGTEDLEPSFPDVESLAPIWAWRGLPPNPEGPTFEALPTPLPSYLTRFFSEPPTNGGLRTILSGDWPENALVSVSLRAQDTGRGTTAWALEAPETRLTGGGTRLECAERVADIIQGAFEQQTGLLVDVEVEEIPGAAAVALTLSLPAAFIDRGLLVVDLFEPVIVETVEPLLGNAGDRVLITGSGFGTDRDALQVYVGHGSTQTPLEVMSAMENGIVARLGQPGPDAGPGPIVVAQALGRRFMPDIPGTTSPNDALQVIQWGNLDSGPIYDPRWDMGIDGIECFESTGGVGELEQLVIPNIAPTNIQTIIQYFFYLPPPLQSPQGIATLSVPGEPGYPQSAAQAICNFFNQLSPYVSCQLDFGPPVVLTFNWMMVSGPHGASIPSDGWVKMCYRAIPLVLTSNPINPALGDLLQISGTGFGYDPDHLKLEIQGANGVSTLLPVVSAADTLLTARLDLVPPDAEAGPMVITRGLGGRRFPAIPGVTHETGIWTWSPTGELPGYPGEFTEIPAPAADGCYESTNNGGFLTLEVMGDWSAPSHVSITFGLDTLGGGDPLAANIGGTSFYLAGGTISAGAEAIRQMMDGLVLTGIGFTHVTVTQTGPNRSLFTIAAQDFFGNPVPITGYVNLCYQTSAHFAGSLHEALGAAQIFLDSGSDTLRISNLADSGADGVEITLGDSQGFHLLLESFKPIPEFDAEVWFNVFGRVAGAETTVAVMQHACAGEDLVITPLTPGVTSYDVELLLDGASVLQRQEVPAASTRLMVQQGSRFPVSAHTFQPQAYSEILSGPLLVDAGTGPVLADAFRIMPRTGAIVPESLTGLQITTIGLSEMTLHEEWLLQFGRSDRDDAPPHRALGQAHLEASEGQLVVSNIGSSGQDGVELGYSLLSGLGRSDPRGIELTLDGNGPVVGRELRLIGMGDQDGQTQVALAEVVLRQTEGDTVALSADFSPSGASGVRAVVVEDGAIVGSATLADSLLGQGRSAIPGEQPRLTGLTHHPLGHKLRFEQPLVFDLSDGSQFIGHEIWLFPATATAGPERWTGSRLLLRNYGSLGVTQETVLPPFTQFAFRHTYEINGLTAQSSAEGPIDSANGSFQAEGMSDPYLPGYERWYASLHTLSLHSVAATVARSVDGGLNLWHLTAGQLGHAIHVETSDSYAYIVSDVQVEAVDDTVVVSATSLGTANYPLLVGLTSPLHLVQVPGGNASPMKELAVKELVTATGEVIESFVTAEYRNVIHPLPALQDRFLNMEVLFEDADATHIRYRVDNTIQRRPPVELLGVNKTSGGPGTTLILTGSGFGADPQNVRVHVNGASGPTQLKVLSATDTQLVAEVGIVRPDAEPGSIVVAQGVSRNYFPTKATGLAQSTDLVEWRVGQATEFAGFPFTPEFFPQRIHQCYYSQPGPDGEICLTLTEDWPSHVQVQMEAVLGQNCDVITGSVTLEGGPGSLVACATNLCQLFDGQTFAFTCQPPPLIAPVDYHLTLECHVLARSPNEVKLTITGKDLLGNAVPLEGHINLCYSTFVFGLPTVAVGDAVLEVTEENHLRVSNLGPGQEGGLAIHVDGAEGWAGEFLPFTLGEGQQLNATLIGELDGQSDQTLSRSTLQVLGGQTLYAADWSAVGSPGYRVVVQPDHRQPMEWGVFNNNEMIPVDAFFPGQDCPEAAVTSYSYWFSDDQYWMRFCKSGCDCFGTNCWTEVVACVFPLIPLRLAVDPVDLVLLDWSHLVATNPLPRGFSLQPPLTSFTITGQKLKRFGYFHTLLGQAGALAGEKALTVANIGSSGQDGVSIEWNPLPQFFGASPVRGFRAALVPLELPPYGSFNVTAQGWLGPITNAFLGQAGLARDGVDTLLTADFMPLRATALTAAVFDQGAPVGSAQVTGDAPLARLSGLNASAPRLTHVGQLPDPPFPFGLTLHFEEPVRFELADGSSLDGNEIRLLPFEPALQPTAYSGLQLRIADTGYFTIRTETVLPAVLRITRFNAQVEVSWSGQGNLEEASDPAGPWQAVQPAPATNRHVESVSSAAKYFRLRQ